MGWPYAMTSKQALVAVAFSAWILGCLGSIAEEIMFTKQRMKVGNKIITVEIAKTSEQRQKGLMNRTRIGQNEGMLFIFDQPQILSFWMKNTKIPLSIAYFDKERRLINIEHMHPPKSVMIQDSQLKRYSSLRPAQYALEMNIGWFKANKIKPGDQFSLLTQKSID